jgi:hypothetical protein
MFRRLWPVLLLLLAGCLEGQKPTPLKRSTPPAGANEPAPTEMTKPPE